MRYVIERQYLLPVFQHLVIAADSVEDACRQAVEHDDWDDAKQDGDSARATTITAIRPVPDDVADRDIDPSSILYGDDGHGAGSLPIPVQYTEEADRAPPAYGAG